jgi:hypothetical protein
MHDLADENKEIWMKSYELLEKLNADHSIKVNPTGKKKVSFSSALPEELTSQASNYKLNDEYFLNMKPKKKEKRTKLPSERSSAQESTLRTRNNTGRSLTEVAPGSASTSSRILYNKKMIDMLLKMINPNGKERYVVDL